MIRARRSRRVGRSAFTLVLTAVTGLTAACAQTAGSPDPSATGGGGRAGGSGGSGAPVPVSTTLVIQKAVPLTVETVGNIEAYSTVDVRAQVSGPLTDVSFAEGEDVKEGQLLFTIDPKPFEVTLQQAQAALAKDQAQANNAQALLTRDTALLKRGLISQSDFDTVATNVATLDAAMKVDQGQVDSARLQLAYTRITAPIAGRTGALLVHRGSLVRTTDPTALVVINQITPVRAAFAVPGDYLGQVRAGQAIAPLHAEAKPSGSTDGTVAGEVTFVDNTVDVSTGTIRLKATFKNTDRRLWPGELVQVTVQLALDSHAIVVPTAAIQNGQQGQYVYVVGTDQTVAVRPVKVSRTNQDDAVVASGLKNGEEVVTDGQLRLTPGAKVTIVKAPTGQKTAS